MSTHGGTSTSAPPATTVTGPDTIGHAAVVGTGLHYARNDHDHGLPALDYNAMQYNDLLGWSSDLSAGNSYGLGAGNVYLSRIPLPAAVTVTNVIGVVVSLGTVLTNAYLGLYKSNGVLIGQSADQSTAWETGGATGIYTLPLTVGPTVCTPLAANDFVWGALYVGTFSTGPTIAGNADGMAAMSNLGCTASRARGAYQSIGNVATLPALTPASNILFPTILFSGLS